IRLYCAIAFPDPSEPAHRRLATSSGNATPLRSAATSDRDIHRVPSAQAEDRSPLKANVALVSHGLYSLKQGRAPPCAIPNRNICDETTPPLHWIPRDCSSTP